VSADPVLQDILETTAAGPAAIRGGFYRVGSLVAGLGLGAVSFAFLVHHLGVVDTGRYVTVLSLIAVAAGVSDLGLTAVGVRELSVQTGPERARIAANLLGVRIVVAAIGTALAVAFAAVAGYDAVMVAGVALAGIGLVLQSTQATLTLSLMSRLRLGWVSVIDLLRQALTVASILALIALGASLLPFLAVSIPVGVVALVVTVIVVHGDVPLRPELDMGLLGPLVRKVLTYSVAVAAATVYFRIALSLISSTHQLGYFATSFRIIEVLIGVPALLVGAAFPIFSRTATSDPDRFVYGLGKVFEVSLLTGIWCALMLGFAGSLAISVIGGSKFAPAAPLLAIQGVGLAASFVGAVWAYALLGLNRYRAILVLNLGALIGGTVLVALLLLADGIHGAAIATTIVEFAPAIVGAEILRRSHPRLGASLARAPRILLAGAIAAVPAVLPSLTTVEAAVISTALYAGSLLALRAVPPEIWAALPGRRTARPAP